MMKKNLGPLTMMGFARYEKRDGVKTEDLIDACLNWRRKFLDHQEGIALHCLLGNLKGQFGDAMLAAYWQDPDFDPAERAFYYARVIEIPTPRWNVYDVVRLGAEVPDGHYATPLGKATVLREGTDVTVISWGTMVHVCRRAIDETELDAELIDLRTLVPLDLETVATSVRKTGRCVVVHEAPRTSGFGAELAASVQEECFWHLEAPVLRVTGWDTPFPHSLEQEYMPSPQRIAETLLQVTTGN